MALLLAGSELAMVSWEVHAASESCVGETSGIPGTCCSFTQAVLCPL